MKRSAGCAAHQLHVTERTETDRVRTHRRTIEFQADWLWNWRQNAPWIIDQASSANRLFPDAPEKLYIYRFNVLLVEG